MEIYRRANVFERILSLYQSPTLSEVARRKILHIIYRAAQVGGSTTLITRAAVISWIQVQVAEGDVKEVALLAALARTLYETSDRERVDAWSAGTVEHALKEISQA
jgi:nucleolar pre-ribosomal-associated protein 1